MRQLRILAWGVLYLIAITAPQLAGAAFPLEVSDAPTDNLSLTLSAIQSARKSIYLNIYELSSPEIADALVSQIQAGIHVEILAEGQPVGGLSVVARGIMAQIAQAMRRADNGDHYYVMSSKPDSAKRRFRFNHAKYAVIDGTNLLIGSENYSPTGNPEPGTKGNRGWEVFVHEAGIAGNYGSVFHSDSSTAEGDVQDIAVNGVLLGLMDPANIWSAATSPSASRLSSPTIATPTLTAEKILRVSSPDSSLSGLLELIDGAQRTLDIEQLTFTSAWKKGGTSPLFEAVKRAAERGVRVRVLLNDESVFDHSDGKSPQKNRLTAEQLNSIPNASARIANLPAMGVDFIHNKGALVDGHLTLISSINWDENSVTNNREAAVVIDGPEVNAHYQALFDSDWEKSASASKVAYSSLDLSPLALELGDALSACPSGLDLNIQIGPFSSANLDESFASLGNTTIAGNFRRTGLKACAFVSQESDGKIARKRFVELRLSKDGSAIFALEGFTQRGNKVYSIRAKLDQATLASGRFEAAVYNGSATHEFLGMARVQLTLLENTANP